MFSYGFITRRPAVPVFTVLLVVIIATLTFTIAGSSAQEGEAPTPRVPVAAGPSEEVLALQEALAVQESQIRVLEQQLASARQAALDSQQRITNQRSTILAIQESLNPDARPEAGMEQWIMGYTLGGGTNLASFQNIILPCESGGEPDPDAAVGPTDDWGRAQINRPTWGRRFTQLTGFAFEDYIRQPVLNGYMAAVVEREHPSGLNAWTCWRRR